MTSETQTLRNPFEGGKVLSEVQLKGYEKAYRELKTEVIAQDKELSTKQIQKLKASLDNLQTIHNKAVASKKQCQLKIVELKKQEKEYEHKINEYQRTSEKLNGERDCKAKIEEGKQTHIQNCQRRIKIAKEIDIYAFRKLQIQERTSPANEIFKWMIVALYGQPENKYYWPNFKEQAIEEDEGRDLIERLGKIDALHAKEDQRVKTVKLIEQEDTIKSSEELIKYQKQVISIFNIAKIFLSSTQVGRDSKDFQKQIVKFQEMSSKGDEQNFQNKNNFKAIQQRIRVSQAYLHQLSQMQSLLNQKLEKYTQQIDLGENYKAELSKISTYVQEYQVPISSEEKRDKCECQIY